MTEQTRTKLEGKFNWNVPEVIASFLQGEEAQAVYDSLGDYVTQLGGILYDKETRTLIGSTPFLAAGIDSLVRPLGIRVANLRDLSRPEVMNMVKDRCYTDAPVLVLKGMKDSCERNKPLIQRIAQEVEEANGKLELPVMIYGFDIKLWPEDEKGYGIDIIRRKDFTAIHDKRLEGYDGERFTEVDELGLPKFDRNGNRTWYTIDQGLSRLYLSRSLDLELDDKYLADSNSDGRVVLVSAECTHENFSTDFQAKLEKRRKEFQAQETEYRNDLQRFKEEIDNNLKKLSGQ